MCEFVNSVWMNALLVCMMRDCVMSYVCVVALVPADVVVTAALASTATVADSHGVTIEKQTNPSWYQF